MTVKCHVPARSGTDPAVRTDSGRWVTHEFSSFICKVEWHDDIKTIKPGADSLSYFRLNLRSEQVDFGSKSNSGAQVVNIKHFASPWTTLKPYKLAGRDLASPSSRFFWTDQLYLPEASEVAKWTEKTLCNVQGTDSVRATSHMKYSS
jgi:hypothetical protein